MFRAARFSGVAVALWGFLLNASPGAAQTALKGVGDVAADFEVIDLESGAPLRLYDYEGSVVVLDFFFYW